MGIRTERPLMAELIFLSMLLMIAALFTSRALLSIGTILFLAFTCVHKESAAQFRNFLRQPMLVGIALLFFIPFFSGFWSEDKEVWARFARIKLPLLFFPLAFAGKWKLSTIQWRILAGFFLFMVLAGCCWSSWQYLQNVQAIHKGYLAAKVIDTPLGNDHVRFSLVVSIGVICAAILLKQAVEKHWRWILGILIVFFYCLPPRAVSKNRTNRPLYFSDDAVYLPGLPEKKITLDPHYLRHHHRHANGSLVVPSHFSKPYPVHHLRFFFYQIKHLPAGRQ